MNKRPYFFEIFAVANLILIVVLLRPMRAPLQTLPGLVLTVCGGFLLQVAIGVAVRAVVAWRRGLLGVYTELLRSPAWLTDTARIAVASGLFIHTYGWIKLSVPLLHPALFDQELWQVGRLLLFGHAPTEFFLTLFSARPVLRAIDWTYANVFFASTFVATAFFGSSPSRRLRIAFMDANTALWIIGAWVYVAVPSLGPAYRFPAMYLPYHELLVNTQALQRLLMTNYQNVLAIARGVPRPVHVLFGVAAFPSLHVAFQMLVFFWVRRLWPWGQMVFGIFAGVILIGSIVTGWHYLVDGLAGIFLGWVCYAISWRAHRMERLFAIRGAARTF